MAGKDVQVLEFVKDPKTELKIEYYFPNIDAGGTSGTNDPAQLLWRYDTIALNTIEADRCPIKCNQTEALVWEIYRIHTFPVIPNTIMQYPPYRLCFALSGTPLKFQKIPMDASGFINNKINWNTYEVMKKDSKFSLSQYDFMKFSSPDDNSFYCDTSKMASSLGNSMELNNFCTNVHVEICPQVDGVGILCHDNRIFLSVADFCATNTCTFSDTPVNPWCQFAGFKQDKPQYLKPMYSYLPRYFTFYLRIRKICFTKLLKELIDKQKDDNKDSIVETPDNVIERDIDPCGLPKKKKICV